MNKYKSTEVIRTGRLSGLIIHHNSIDLNWSNRDLDHPRRFGVYITYFMTEYGIVIYIGKAVYYWNQDGSMSYKSRPLSHRDDSYALLMEQIGPENCIIDTLENLTEYEAKAAEAWLISLINGTTMSRGQKRWRGEKFLNKRCEDVNRDLINYFNLDINNDVESFRRKVNKY